jgi:hypothetical protein
MRLANAPRYRIRGAEFTDGVRLRRRSAKLGDEATRA